MKTYAGANFSPIAILRRYDNWRYHLRKRRNASKYNRKMTGLYKEVSEIDENLKELQALKDHTLSKISFLHTSLTIHKIGD